jgi:hypothetical protein
MIRKIFILVTSVLCTFSFAQDLYTKREAPVLKILDPITITANVRNYPILPVGNPWSFAFASTSYSSGTGSGVPIANLHLVNLENNKFLAAMEMKANLEELSSVGDWVSEPCKNDNYLWKKSIGGKFTNVNCASIGHVVRYFAAPTGSYSQLLVHMRDRSIDIPQTVIRVTFTRYIDRGRWLSYRVDINPEYFGVARDAESIWGANGWHKSFIDRDVKRTEFLKLLSKWVESVQDRMDKAFDKNPNAFAGLPSLSSALNPPSTTPSTQSTPAIEERLKTLKDLYDKKLLTEDQYNEQVRTVLSK